MNHLMELPEIVRRDLLPIESFLEKEMVKMGLEPLRMRHLDFRTTILVPNFNVNVNFEKMKMFYKDEPVLLGAVMSMQEMEQYENVFRDVEFVKYNMNLDPTIDEIFFFIDDEAETYKEKKYEPYELEEIFKKCGFSKEIEEIKFKEKFLKQDLEKDDLMNKVREKYEMEEYKLVDDLLERVKIIQKKAEKMLKVRNKKMEVLNF